MKLKHRLAIYSIIIFSIIIGTVEVITYVSFYNIAQFKELKSLESKSVLAAIYYLDQDELTIIEHEDIRKQLAKKASRNDIAVFSINGQQVNGKLINDSNITPKFLKEVIRKGDDYLITENYFYNGILYKDNQGDFTVITRESKTEFKDQLQSLLNILVITFILSLIFIYFFSHFLGYIAYEPINNIIKQIKVRNYSNFQEPLKLEKSYAEVDTLIKTYNQFIQQIAETFSIQKNFIDYVSHELRTPITALIGTLEVANSKERSVSEYQHTIQTLKQYTRDMEETLDNMMLLSGAKTTFEMKTIRMDEVLWHVVENAILYHQATIEVSIHVQDTELLKSVANEKLLDLALSNLLSNAIKYSNNAPIQIIVNPKNGVLEILIKDAGIGIIDSDLNKIKGNFYRGENTADYQGKGIGLSMANIIFKLHHIEMEIFSNSPKGTVVQLRFPKF